MSVLEMAKSLIKEHPFPDCSDREKKIYRLLHWVIKVHKLLGIER